MSAHRTMWRPLLAGGGAYGLAGLVLVGMAVALGHLGLPLAALGLLWLGLVVPLVAEAAKLLALPLAGGIGRWAGLGAGFGASEAALQLWRSGSPALAGAAAAVLLHAALGGLARAVAARHGRLPAFLLALLLHALANLGMVLAVQGLAHRGIPAAAGSGYVALCLALGPAIMAWRYSAASRTVAPSPKASASSL